VTSICTFIICIFRARGLTSIPRFNLPSDATIIDLSQNQIKTLSEFPPLENLISLNLTDNIIDTIEPDAFDDLDVLTSLYLSNNKIRFIEADTFEWGPEKLEIIKLDYNRMEVIQQDVFEELNFLEEIDLSNNRLNYIHPNAFRELKKLKTLTLDNNQVKLSSRSIKNLIIIS